MVKFNFLVFALFTALNSMATSSNLESELCRPMNLRLRIAENMIDRGVAELRFMSSEIKDYLRDEVKREVTKNMSEGQIHVHILKRKSISELSQTIEDFLERLKWPEETKYEVSHSDIKTLNRAFIDIEDGFRIIFNEFVSLQSLIWLDIRHTKLTHSKVEKLAAEYSDYKKQLKSSMAGEKNVIAGPSPSVHGQEKIVTQQKRKDKKRKSTTGATRRGLKRRKINGGTTTYLKILPR